MGFIEVAWPDSSPYPQNGGVQSFRERITNLQLIQLTLLIHNKSSYAEGRDNNSYMLILNNDHIYIHIYISVYLLMGAYYYKECYHLGISTYYDEIRSFFIHLALPTRYLPLRLHIWICVRLFLSNSCYALFVSIIVESISGQHKSSLLLSISEGVWPLSHLIIIAKLAP